jgi:hypothetical protein
MKIFFAIELVRLALDRGLSTNTSGPHSLR